MAGFKELRTRIESVKSTHKITSAMKLVAASRLRKAEGLLHKSEFYNHNLAANAYRLLHQMKTDDVAYVYPELMTMRANPLNYLLLVFTSDRGLCGNFNQLVAKQAIARAEELLEQGKEVQIICAGKKGKDIIKRKHPSLIVDCIEDIAHKGVKYYEGVDLAERITKMFKNKEIDVCEVVATNFKSVMNRENYCHQVLPIKIEEFPYNKVNEPMTIIRGAFYEYEPNKLELLTHMMPLLLRATMFQVIANSQACEHGARMTSMDNATNNAKDMMSGLTLKYNRLRQNAITTELIEIIAGAEAL
ncbi:MAG: ATP synthase F1 subunit gamma [Alphaproteobacteria bacterium]